MTPATTPSSWASPGISNKQLSGLLRSSGGSVILRNRLFCAWNTGPHNSRKQRDGKFYLGGKVGATYGDVKTTIHGLEDGSRSRTISSTKFSWAAQAGFKFSISNSADFVLGYEYYQIQGYNDPGYHTIKLGFSWNF